MPIFSSLDKDQIKAVIDEVTRWLVLAEEGDWTTLPGVTGRQQAAPRPGSRGTGRCHVLQDGGASLLPRWILGGSSAGTWSLWFGRAPTSIRRLKGFPPILNFKVEGVKFHSEPSFSSQSLVPYGLLLYCCQSLNFSEFSPNGTMWDHDGPALD